MSIGRAGDASTIDANPRRLGFQLFLVGFLTLFLELTCIRWFAAYVIFLQFFTNVALIAAFLGMSCGCLAARSKRDWLALTPLLMLGTVVAAFAVYGIYQAWSGLAFEVGHQASPQEIFWPVCSPVCVGSLTQRINSMYSLIHLLRTGSGGEHFRDVLVIGAGSGNDLAHALRFGAERIDAVEIDPVIQDIGMNYHPNRPYQDSRVTPYLDDGRHFLRTTDRKYDLVVYAAIDSLILHSSYANLRLESYLFTQEAFADIKRVLKPEGVFVTYNQFRQGWDIERVAAMAEGAFGCKHVDG